MVAQGTLISRRRASGISDGQHKWTDTRPGRIHMLYGRRAARFVDIGHGERKVVGGIQAGDIIGGEMLVQARGGQRHCQEGGGDGALE